MLQRLRSLFPARYELLTLIEVGVVGLLFVQALQYLIGMLYSRTASAALAASYPPDLIPPDTAGLVQIATINAEITFLGLLLALPVLGVIISRFRILSPLLVGMIGLARVAINANGDLISPVVGAEIVVGVGLLYITMLIRHRATALPYFFIIGIAADQVLRIFGDTLDPSLSPAYLQTQIGVSIAVFLVSIMAYVTRQSDTTAEHRAATTVNPNLGTMTFWSGLGMGALLFLELSLLSLPNAIAGRSDADYTTFAPAIVFATLLPLVPFIRIRMRHLISPFDSGTRGYIWLVLIALLLVLGTRLTRISLGGVSIPLGATMLVVAQFTVSLLWWWFVRPRADGERQFSGLWLMLGMLVFGGFVLGDIFTYEYAFVRNLAPPLDALNSVVVPILRGFRGMGLGLLLVASLIATIPMILATRRVPWTGGNLSQSLFMSLVVASFTFAAATAARPPMIQPVINVDEIRIGTYNIHGGYSEFYDYNLEAIARTIRDSGAQVVLLQEVDAGRLTSFGVDQSLWLARRLGMDRRFFPTNEGLQGLAVLSRVPIAFDDGVLLTSIDQQTGLQRVQIQPDQGAITIYNTMLGFLLAGETQEEQERNQRQQLTEILNTIERHIRQDYGGQLGRTILGGTFHNIPDSPLIDTLRTTGFVDPFAGANPTIATTLRRVDRNARIDFLWLWRQSLSATGNNVIDTAASDHRLAVVGVRIR